MNGKLRLNFSHEEKTRLSVKEQIAPLKVVRAFSQEDGAALVHLHNLSGGVLSGDRLEMNVEVEPEARVQLTTTGATRIYRRRQSETAAYQSSNFKVGSGALLEYLPDPLIPFAGSNYHQQNNFELAEGAGLFWWEVLAPGREARGELFEYERLQLGLKIIAPDGPVVLENSLLEPALRPLSSPARFGPYRYYGSFFICRVGVAPERWKELENCLAEMAVGRSQRGTVVWGVSRLRAHGLVIKALALNGREISSSFTGFWQKAKQELYGRAAILPRKIY